MFQRQKFKTLIQDYKDRKIDGSYKFYQSIDPEDITYIQKLKRDAFTHSFLISCILVPSIYLGSRAIRIPKVLKNPLSSATAPIEVKFSNSGVLRNVVAIKLSLFTVLALYGFGIIKYQVAKFLLYDKYKRTVDRYVSLKEDQILDSIVAMNRLKKAKDLQKM